MPEQICARAQIAGNLILIPNTGYNLAGNFAPDADFNGLSFLLQELLQQQRRAQAGMDHSQNLKAEAVAAAEINR